MLGKVKKMRFFENQAQSEFTIFWQNLIFLVEIFLFQRTIETFVCTLRTCSRYLQGPPDLDVASVKTLGPTVRHTNKRISTKRGV